MGVEEIVDVDGTEFVFAGSFSERFRQKKAAYNADPEFRAYVERHGGYSEYFKRAFVEDVERTIGFRLDPPNSIN